MNSTKIALISEHASPLAALGGVDAGGQNIAVGELAQHLSNLGYEVDVFTRWDDKRLPRIVMWRGTVRIVHIKAGPVTYVPKEELLEYMDEFTKNTLAFFKEEQTPYKLVHAHFWMSALVASKIKEQLGTPYVITFHALGKVRQLHQGMSDHFPKERIAIETTAIRNADQVVALCPQDKDDLVTLYGADPGKITIIPNGYNGHDFYPVDTLVARMVLGLDPHERIVLQLGRLVERKGVDTVIRAIARLKRDHKLRTRLLVVGGDSDEPDPAVTPEIARLQGLAQSEGVEELVTFVGRRGRDALRYYYSAADVFVTTPWYEPFGITPLESMACGTPTIGSAVGGIKSTIIDGVNGLLVPPKDPEALAGRLAEVLQSRKLLSYLSENALAHVAANYTWEKVANMTAGLYEKVVLDSPLRMQGESEALAIIDESFTGLEETLRRSRRQLRVAILDAAQTLSRVLAQHGRVLLCGNGGSAAQAQHFAAELTGYFEVHKRRALSFIPLTSDSTFITAWANDTGFEQIFARQIEAYGQPGDILVALTTSGKSPNILEAIKAAHRRGMLCIVCTGKSGGQAGKWADITLTVPGVETAHIQEMHLHIIHTLCRLIERKTLQNDREKDRVFQSARGELEDLLTRNGK